MRNPTYNLTLNLPNNHVLKALYPISCGPYMGNDVLMLMDNMCARYYVVRATLDGKHLSTSELVMASECDALIKKMICEQSDKNCSAVTCGGRYGCD
jgi:hypothetical protein